MVVAEETFAGPFVENLEDLEAKVVKRIIKSFVELPEVPRQLSKLYLKLAGEEANKVILEADAEEPNEVIAEEADKAIELVDPEVVTEPFIENLEDLEAAKSREKYYQFDCRTAGEEAKLYLRLTPKNLMRLLPNKLIKLSN